MIGEFFLKAISEMIAALFRLLPDGYDIPQLPWLEGAGIPVPEALVTPMNNVWAVWWVLLTSGYTYLIAVETFEVVLKWGNPLNATKAS